MSNFRGKTILRFIAAGSILALFAGQGFGQAGRGRIRLTGVVTNDDGNPIASAKIVLRRVETIAQVEGRIDHSAAESVSFEAVTDKKGKWIYTGLGPGVWEVTASAMGYHPASRNCTVFELRVPPVVPLRLEKALAPGTENLTESALLEKAGDFFYSRKFDDALALYEEYLRFRPDDVMVALSIGNCLAEKGDVDAAIGRYELVLEKTSRDPTAAFVAAKAYGSLGECYWMKKDSGKAEASFRRALEKGAENEQWAFNIGEICFSRGAIDEAIGYYQKAAGLAPNWSDPEYKLGLAFLNKGDRPRARGHFEKFLRLEPGTARSAEVKKILKDLG